MGNIDINLWQFIWVVMAVPIGMLANYFSNLKKDHKDSRKKIWDRIDEETEKRIIIETKLAILEDRENQKHEIP